jgi:hypothetical protein
VEEDGPIAFGQKFPGKGESVRQCVAMIQLLLSPKFGVKSSHISMQLP